MMKGFPRFTILISATIAVVPILTGCSSVSSKSADGGGPPAMSVKVQPAQLTTITESTTFSATVKSRQSVMLSPQVEGTVRKIFVTAGDEVKVGTPIMEISPEKERASVESFKDGIDSASKDLASAREGLKSLQSQRVGKVSNVELALSFRDRYKSLAESGAVSKMDSEQRNNAYDAAKADLEALDAQIKAQQESINKYDRQVEQARALLKQEQATLGYYIIKAPFAGVVGDVPVKVGTFVNTQTQLTSVTQNKPLEVYVEVPVEKVHDVRLHAPIELMDSDNNVLGVSHVMFIAPNVSIDSQTVLVKAQYDNADGELKADETVRAKVIWNKRPGILIPTEAVSHQSGEDFLFLADNTGSKQTAHQINVTLGDIEGSAYQVLQGVKPGDPVIVSGIQNLADKFPITVSQ
ncbi:MAG TPA: efflux RND transporter periplasmic adaptor subunit [Planktothrix sp.]|jgi:multidrug efflux pump subunit AcrA (membrane-fusion protein)